MLNCREATEMISQGLDRRLSLAERMALALHLAICRGCRATDKHLRFLRSATRMWRQHHDASSTQQGDSQ